MKSANDSLPVGTQLKEFEIVDLIGAGAFGIVYLANDRLLKRQVAIKEYMPSDLASRKADDSVVVNSQRNADTFEIGRQSFLNEAQILAQFDHPSLVKVYQFWEEHGTAYMAMQYYSGQTLSEKMTMAQPCGQRDELWVKRLVTPIMDALELLHSKGVLHRDVSPDNIMVQHDDRTVLLDCGAARLVISDRVQDLTVILKYGFAPIEQHVRTAVGGGQGPWTDIYALAAVIYWVLTGRMPPEALSRANRDTYEPLAIELAGRYTDRFLRGVDRCLAFKADERPQNIEQMRELLGFTQGATVLASSDVQSGSSLAAHTHLTANRRIGEEGAALAVHSATRMTSARALVIGGSLLLIVSCAVFFLSVREASTTKPAPQAVAPSPTVRDHPSPILNAPNESRVEQPPSPTSPGVVRKEAVHAAAAAPSTRQEPRKKQARAKEAPTVRTPSTPTERRKPVQDLDKELREILTPGKRHPGSKS